MSRRDYTDEFRQEAVRLALGSDKSVAQVAKDLSLSVNTLKQWIRTTRLEDPSAGRSSETAEQKLRRLEHENDQLRQERDILKKAIAYFAQPQTK